MRNDGGKLRDGWRRRTLARRVAERSVVAVVTGLGAMVALLATTSFGQDQPWTIDGWTETTSVPETTNWTAALAYDGHVLYMLYSGQIYVGEVASDGSISEWVPTIEMPRPEINVKGAVIVGDRVIVPSAPDSMIGLLNDDGTISGWSYGPGVANPANNGRVSTTYGNRIYTLGGSYPYWQMSNMVETAEMLPDGSLSPWQETSSLIEGTGIVDPMALVHDNYLYVFGGETGAGDLHYSANVHRSPILENGVLGEWQYVGSLLIARPHSGSLSHAGSLHVVGGGVHSYMTSVVESVLLEDLGTPGAALWSAPLPTVLNEPATVTVGRFGYVLGGNSCTYGGCYPADVLVAELGPDDLPPVLSLPDNLTVEAVSPAGATVTYVATAHDNLDGEIPAVCSPSSGSLFALGTSIVRCSATDSAGNVAAGTFAVSVVDTIPPQISGLSATPEELWPPDHTLRIVVLSATVTDAADTTPSLAVVRITSNEGSPLDWVIVDALTVQVRAERYGTGAGRVYTVSVEAVDESGNVSHATVDVTAPHNR